MVHVIDRPCDSQSRGIVLAASVGSIQNLILSAAKIAVGSLTSSQSLMADGVHSLSDLITDFAIILGAKYWSAPADASHPYGHGRLETLINLLIGTVVGIVAIAIAYKGIVSITTLSDNQLGWPVLLMALISVVSKEVLYQWTLRQGKKYRSRALVANAWHHRSDALSSLPVLLAVIAGWVAPWLKFLDALAAVLIAALLISAAYKIVRPVINELMESENPDCARSTRETLAEIEHVTQVCEVRCRSVGGAAYIDIRIVVDSSMTLVQLHELQHNIEARLKAKHPELMAVMFHVEPDSCHNQQTP